jgi:hypothetical protein
MLNVTRSEIYPRLLFTAIKYIMYNSTEWNMNRVQIGFIFSSQIDIQKLKLYGDIIIKTLFLMWQSRLVKIMSSP